MRRRLAAPVGCSAQCGGLKFNVTIGTQRLLRIGRLVIAGDFAYLAYALWLRLHRLEFGDANYVAPQDGYYHSQSGGPYLAKVLKSIRIPDDSVAIDFGVGMGIAALTLSRYFSRVIGVDLSPELITVAKRNLTRMQNTKIELHCADARLFREGLDQVSHVYMFNPFPAPVMAVVMGNLRQSLSRAPRTLTIIYKYPSCHETVLLAGFAHERTFRFRNSHPFAIYGSKNVRGETHRS